MSISLLRQVILKRSTCPISLSFRRTLASHATLMHRDVPMDHSQSSEYQEPHAAAVETSNADSEPLSGDSIEMKDESTASEKPKTKKKVKKPKKTSVSRRDPPGALIDLLKGLETSGCQPTLEDLEKYRPKGHTLNVESSEYSGEYIGLRDQLCRTFSRDQLRELTKLCRLDSRRVSTKTQHAECIIEKHWQWPSLKEVQMQQQDRTEISVKSERRVTISL